MSDYTQITSFGPKDSLPSGNPSKLIKGTEFDAEFAALATAIASKFDSTDVASTAEAQAETLNTKVVTPLRLAEWSDANAGVVGDLHALSSPGADRILFWDQSGTAAGFLTVSTGLTLTGTALTANMNPNDLATTLAVAADSADLVAIYDTSEGTAKKISVTNLVAGTGFVPTSRNLSAGTGLTGGGDLASDRTFALDTANTRNTDHASVSISAGTGLSGGGTIAATRTLNLDFSGLTATTIATGDFVAVYDVSAAAMRYVTATNLSTAIAHDSTSGFVADEHVAHSSVSISAGSGLTGGGTIAANRTLSLNVNGLTQFSGTPAGTDQFLFYDASASTHYKMTYNSASLPSRNVSTSGNFASTDVTTIVYWTGTTGTLTMPTGIGQDDCWIVVINSGSGVLTIAGSGVTITSANSTVDIPPGGMACLVRETSTVWFLGGDRQ